MSETVLNYGLDTSALLRILTGEPSSLAVKCALRIQSIFKSGGTVSISDLVVSEAYYALQFHYQKPKEAALEAFRTLFSTQGFECSEAVRDALATKDLAHANPGFADRVIAGDYLARGRITLSCEKSFRRLQSTEVIRDADV